MRGFDTFLFISLALLITSVLFGRWAAIWVLLSGGIFGALNYFVNLREISNAIAYWLSVEPPDLFFYAFLPPLILDEALHLDFFLFRKIWIHAVLLAFVMVLISAILLTPIILFVMGFQNRGWTWVHGALFSAIIAPTDALAVAAILSQSGGPERLTTLVQSESLLNDASGITLYIIFSQIIFNSSGNLKENVPSVGSVIPDIIVDIIRLTAIGIGIGLAMSIITGEILRWLRWRGAKPVVETTLVLSLAYLTFYVTNAPANGSGVIAVAVYGLYGNFKSKWGMLADAEENGAFDAVWDLISFAANGLIFFWSGIASVNYTIRSVRLLNRSAWSYVAIPLIYIFMLLIRTSCVALFNPIFKLLGEGLDIKEILFVGWAGLRGGVSLIMVSAFMTGSMLTLNAAFSENASEADKENAYVNADISLWTACFVVLTLLINGTGTSPLMKILRLGHIPEEKLRMRGRAKRALFRFTQEQLALIKKDENEFLQGADWEAIEEYVDLSKDLAYFDQDENTRNQKKIARNSSESNAIRIESIESPQSSLSSSLDERNTVNSTGASSNSIEKMNVESSEEGSNSKAWKEISTDELTDEMKSQVPFFKTRRENLNWMQDLDYIKSTITGRKKRNTMDIKENERELHDVEKGFQSGEGVQGTSDVVARGSNSLEESLLPSPCEDDVQQSLSLLARANLMSALQEKLSESSNSRDNQAYDLEKSNQCRSLGSTRDEQSGESSKQRAFCDVSSKGARKDSSGELKENNKSQYDDAYYCSLPVYSRSKLQDELKKQLESSRQVVSDDNNNRNAKNASNIDGNNNDFKHVSSFEFLEEHNESKFEDFYSDGNETSLRHKNPEQVKLSPSDRMPRTRKDFPAPMKRNNLDHSATISGLAGANLQAELSQYLHQAKKRTSHRDLLGRRYALGTKAFKEQRTNDPASSSFPTDIRSFSISNTRTPMADALASKGFEMQKGSLSRKSQFKTSVGRSRQPRQDEFSSFLRAQGARHPMGYITSTWKGNKDDKSTNLESLRSDSVSIRSFPTNVSHISSGKKLMNQHVTSSGRSHGYMTSPFQINRHSNNDKKYPTTEHVSDKKVYPYDKQHDGQAMLTEMRIRLIAGLKRRFIAKRMSGLISVQALRILEYACDRASEEDFVTKRISIWRLLEVEVSGGWIIWLTSRISVASTIGFRSLPQFLRTVLSVPYREFAKLLRRQLGNYMLVACEVAVEYYLGLVSSPQILWFRNSLAVGCFQLLREVDEEVEAAHRFIIAREIEAPDRFGAIQSYRAAMAILKQQCHFVNELFEAGMLDQREHESMFSPIERRMQRLEMVGPIWRPPRPKSVLRSLPFIFELPEKIFDKIWREGSVMEWKPGETFWNATWDVMESEGQLGPGSYVVLSGIVRRIYRDNQGLIKKEYFQGTGSMVGVLLSMTGTRLPGSEMAIAEGNALGKGPILFHLPQYLSYRIIEGADKKQDDYSRKLYYDLLRLSAIYIIENMDDTIVHAVRDHIATMTQTVYAAQEGLQANGSRSSEFLSGAFDDTELTNGMRLPQPLRDEEKLQPIPEISLNHMKHASSNLLSMMKYISALEQDEEFGKEKNGIDSKMNNKNDEANLQDIGLVMSREENDIDMPSVYRKDGSEVKTRTPQADVDANICHVTARNSDEQFLLAQENAPELAADVLKDIRYRLVGAIPIKLPPETYFRQQTHVVVVQGELTSEDGTETNIYAPTIIPWLWEPSLLCNKCRNFKMVVDVGWRTGASGAILVVCPNSEGLIPKISNTSGTELLRGFYSNSDENITVDNNKKSGKNSEQSSFTGRAAAALGRELSNALQRLRK